MQDFSSDLLVYELHGYSPDQLPCDPYPLWPCKQKPIELFAELTGPGQGTGSATVSVDLFSDTVRFQVKFRDLCAKPILAVVHGPAVDPSYGSASPLTRLPSLVGFPKQSTTGEYNRVFKLTDPQLYSQNLLAANFDNIALTRVMFLDSLFAQRSYFSIKEDIESDALAVFATHEVRGPLFCS